MYIFKLTIMSYYKFSLPSENKNQEIKIVILLSMKTTLIMVK